MCPLLLFTGAAATGSYLDGKVTRGGWYQLSISTSPDYTDQEQALALGYLEGWLSGAPALCIQRLWASSCEPCFVCACCCS